MTYLDILTDLAPICERLARRDPTYEMTLRKLHQRLSGLVPALQRFLYAEIRKRWPDALDPEWLQ